MKYLYNPDSIKITCDGDVRVPSRRRGEEARFGVGENITLVPAQSLPGNMIGAWSIVSGSGTLENLGLNKCIYHAPNLDAESLQNGAREFQVSIGLFRPGTLSKRDLLVEVQLNIVAPNAGWLDKLANIHVTGAANAGFWGQHIIGPNDVSFMGILLKESRGTFLVARGPLDVFNGEQGIIHEVTSQWLVPKAVDARGTIFNATDKVYTPAKEPAGGWKQSLASQEVGRMTWDIAWMYKLPTEDSSEPDKPGIQFARVPHKAWCFGDGRLCTEKGGSQHTATILDPSENWSAPPPAP